MAGKRSERLLDKHHHHNSTQNPPPVLQDHHDSNILLSSHRAFELVCAAAGGTLPRPSVDRLTVTVSALDLAFSTAAGKTVVHNYCTEGCGCCLPNTTREALSGIRQQ